MHVTVFNLPVPRQPFLPSEVDLVCPNNGHTANAWIFLIFLIYFYVHTDHSAFDYKRGGMGRAEGEEGAVRTA